MCYSLFIYFSLVLKQHGLSVILHNYDRIKSIDEIIFFKFIQSGNSFLWTDLITNAYAEFQHKDIVSLAAVNNFHVLELFHGKTLAFKDFSLACVGTFMDYFLNKRRKHVITVVSTSGDTGSAAIESVRKSKWVDIIVMYPEGRCSQIQELQMTTILDENVHVIRGEGSSDDLDVPMKKCFSDDAFAKSNNLCVVNSINWCRIMVQTVHLLYAYLRVCCNVGDTVKFVIPSGGLGHCTGK